MEEASVNKSINGSPLLPVGTRVVTRREICTAAGKLVYPAGAMGVMVASLFRWRYLFYLSLDLNHLQMLMPSLRIKS